MRIFTTEYEWCHNKKPRGRGLWFFYCQVGNEYPESSFHGTYTEAKKQATTWCKKINGVGLTVMP